MPSTQIANLIITKWRTTFIVQLEEFDLPNMVFDMISMWLHVYYLEKTDTDKQCGFVQTVADNMKLFTKQQIEGALKAESTSSL